MPPFFPAIFRASFHRPGQDKHDVDSTARRISPATGWKIEDSLDLYGVEAWGNGYFGINDAGHVVVRPDQSTDQEIDLYEVVRGLEGAISRHRWCCGSPTSCVIASSG